MAVKQNQHTSITVALAFIDEFIGSMTDYQIKIDYLTEYLIRETGVKNIEINPDGLYLTVTGTSAECGDSGQVGRGNRYNGVIPLCRPMSSEAFHGKNPVIHIGKIYNRLAFEMAEKIVGLGVDEAYVWLVGVIGKALNKPEVFISYKSKSNYEKEIKRLIKDAIESKKI